ncbi:SapC family protein [Neptuniibacter sp. 2_MG-2023]|uniref:SapC family protein n=1 Tax=Neptuniibacter sp. 2_MG-2023 TaxID=3062671 RepID=UPI0026E3BFF2|nr:SapC family protein [Neptuniibacter sp. 2_MG-2023]MDO6514487.1 SapC family protein [Neptuniibacter sp. 2_MG-2023]
MSTQLLIYGDVQPVNKQRHAGWSVKAGNQFGFAQGVNSVPLMAVEFPNAAEEYSIVFAGEGDNLLPVVLMGVREDENLYVDSEGGWSAKYIPAFVRRYPFVFSSADEGATLTLCIDEGFEGCNEEGRGERLFDAEGEQTQYLNSVLDFLKEYQAHYQRTKSFAKKLVELDLLEPMGAQFTTPAGEKRTVTGFQAINRDKLKALSPDKFSDLAKTDELELIYLHLQSMRNFSKMLDKVSTTKAEEAEEVH